MTPLASSLASLDFDPRKLLRRRSSLVVADLPPVERDRMRNLLHDMDGVKEETGNEEKKPEKKELPTVFKEPEANSLLDAFGF